MRSYTLFFSRISRFTRKFREFFFNHLPTLRRPCPRCSPMPPGERSALGRRQWLTISWAHPLRYLVRKKQLNVMFHFWTNHECVSKNILILKIADRQLFFQPSPISKGWLWDRAEAIPSGPIARTWMRRDEYDAVLIQIQNFTLTEPKKLQNMECKSKFWCAYFLPGC